VYHGFCPFADGKTRSRAFRATRPVQLVGARRPASRRGDRPERRGLPPSQPPPTKSDSEIIASQPRSGPVVRAPRMGLPHGTRNRRKGAPPAPRAIRQLPANLTSGGATSRPQPDFRYWGLCLNLVSDRGLASEIFHPDPCPVFVGGVLQALLSCLKTGPSRRQSFVRFQATTPTRATTSLGALVDHMNGVKLDTNNRHRWKTDDEGRFSTRTHGEASGNLKDLLLGRRVRIIGSAGEPLSDTVTG
jgi:hypothetical protein